MTKTKSNDSSRKAMTPKARVSFPHVFEPHSGFENQPAKYSCTFLIPKDADISSLKKAAKIAADEKWGVGKHPKTMRSPFRDGDEKEDLNGYAGHIFISASSKERPGVVDGSLNDIIDASDFYAGCYARATLIAFAYDNMGSKGVSFALQNIQKLGDGEAFSGRKKAKEEFEMVDDGSETFGSDFDSI